MASSTEGIAKFQMKIISGKFQQSQVIAQLRRKLTNELSAGHVESQELKYQPHCQVDLYSEERTYQGGRDIELKQIFVRWLSKENSLSCSELAACIMEKGAASHKSHQCISSHADLVPLWVSTAVLGCYSIQCALDAKCNNGSAIK